MPSKNSIPPVVCTCPICGAEFRRWPAQIADGRGKYCSRPCLGRARALAATGPDPAKIKERRQRYAARHRDEIGEKQRQWREANAAYRSEKGRAWRDAHPGRTVAATKQWRIDNPDRFAAQRRAGACNARARAAGATGFVSTADVVALWERQPTCIECGNDRGVDHIVEFWQGGSNTPDNLQNLCAVCNTRKTARLRFGSS